jgi:hypothetical protein
MSFSDPLSVTFAAPLTVGAVSLPRISVGSGQSSYQSSDGLVSLNASSMYGRRTRRMVRIDYKKISADTFIPDTNVEKKMGCYLVFDLPTVGFTNAEALALYTGFKGTITATSDLLVSKLLGGES